MAIERTFSIIKPDAVAKHAIGTVLGKLEAGGLRVVAQKMIRMTTEQAQGFYAVHKERPFFGDLVKFMTEGPVVVQVLEGENAIAKNREIMGATNSKEAAAGTIRAEVGTDIERNAVHGSDAPETAATEIAFFFSTADLASTQRLSGTPALAWLSPALDRRTKDRTRLLVRPGSLVSAPAHSPGDARFFAWRGV